MNMPFYNIPSFPFFSSSFYLFLIDFSLFLPFLETKRNKREDKNISITLASFQGTPMANLFPSYLFISEKNISWI